MSGRPLATTSLYRKHSEGYKGFRILDKETVVRGKHYTKWYATKQYQGKRLWVYIGASKDGAEQKIDAYLARKGILLKEAVAQSWQIETKRAS